MRRIKVGSAYVTQPDAIGMLAVPDKDWHRIRNDVDRLRNPIWFAAGLAWACVGLVVAVVFFLLTWWVTYPSLPSATQVDARWVTPSVVVIGLAATIIAILAFVMDRKVAGELRKDAQAICAEMDDIHAAHDQLDSPSQ